MGANWLNSIFIKNPTLLNNTEVKKAMQDGKITEEEYLSFKTSGMRDYSESYMRDLEEDYTEALNLINDNKNASSETNSENKIISDPLNLININTPFSLDLKNPFANLFGSSPSDIRKNTRPEATVNTNGDLKSLKGELKEENGTLTDNEKILSDVLSGNDSDLQSLQGDIDEKYEIYIELLEKVSPELAEKVDDKKTEIDNKKKEISEKEQEISTQDGIINKAEINLSNAKSNRDNISSQLSSLRSQLSSAKDEEKSAIESAINTKESELTTAKEAVTKAEDDLSEAEEKYDELVEQKKELESGEKGSLKVLNEEMAKLEEDVKKLNSEEINTAKENYNTAQNKYDETKATKTSEAQNAIAQSRSNIQALEVKIYELEIEEAEKNKEKEAKEVNNSGVYSGGSVGGSSGTNSANKTKNSEKTEAENNLKDAKADFEEKESKLKSIYSGTDPEISEARENANKSFDDLQAALNDAGYSSLAEQIGNVKSELDTKMSELDSVNSQILDQENALATAQTNATKNNSMILTYEATLSELKSIDTSKLNAKQKQDLNEKIKELNAEISKAKNETANQIAKMNENASENLETLKARKNELEQDVIEINNELEGLLAQVPADCKTQANDFKTAQDNYVDIKTTKEASAKKDLETSRSTMNKADIKLSKLNDAENVKKYQISNSSAAVDWARQFDDYSQSSIQSIFSKYGYDFHYDAWCGDFVRMALMEGVGEENLPDWYRNCPNKAFCPTLQDSAKGHEVSAEDAKPGDMVLFDWNGDGSADHVGLFVDNGNGSTTITAIEGNTSGSGGGSCVEEKARDRGNIIGIYSMSN